MRTFTGTQELRRFMIVKSETIQDMKVTKSGNCIIVDGNKSFFKHVISGSYQGKRAEVLAICTYEFEDDKIKKLGQFLIGYLWLNKQLEDGFPGQR